MNVSRLSPFTALCCLILVLGMFSGCSRYDFYDGEIFDCDCGYMTWDGRNLNMRMAEVEHLDSETFRYHIVADVRTRDEREAREEPRDVILTLSTALNGATTTIDLDGGDDALTIQQVESAGASLDWTMSGATVLIEVRDDKHIMNIASLSATRGNNTIDAMGEVTFDLVD